MESVTCFGKVLAKVGKSILVGSTKVNTRHFSKVSEFSFMTNFQALTEFKLIVIEQLTEIKKGCLSFS